MRFPTLEESGLSKQDYVWVKAGARQACIESYYCFFKMFWDSVIPEPLIENFHIKYICDALQEVAERMWRNEPAEYDLVINVSPGESKSTMVSVLFPVWLWINNPKQKVLTNSHSAGLAQEHAVLSRDIIKDEMFQDLFGDDVKIRRDIDSKARYATTKGGFRKANSIGGKITGSHANIVIIDDPLSPEVVRHPNQLAEVKRYINETLPSRVTNKTVTPFILVMQRLHEDDTAGDWLKNRNVKHICLPATIDHPIYPPEMIEYYQDGLMNPKRTGVNVLRKFIKLLGTRQYSNQFGQETSASEGNIILTSWFDVLTMDQIPQDLWEYPVMFYSDTGDKDKEDSDPTGMLACIYHPTGILYLIDYVEWVCRFSERVRNMKDVFNLWGSPQSILKIEAKSSGVSVKDVLLSEPYNVNAMEWVAAGGSKEGRARLCEGVFEAGRVKIVKDVARKWTEAFMEQLKLFPNAVHDECVDVLTMATIDEVLRRLPAFDRQWIGLN